MRAKDLSPVNYKRVAEKDGKEVPWDQIVKGYQYEKDKFIVLKDEDFQRVDLEATQTVDIQDFVEQEEIDPVFFYKPYYLEPQKGGDKAYVLLRDTLKKTGKVGIAKVVVLQAGWRASFILGPVRGGPGWNRLLIQDRWQILIAENQKKFLYPLTTLQNSKSY